MKRKRPILSFESEGLSNPALEKQQRITHDQSQGGNIASPPGTFTTKPAKEKRKKFAWMDSDDESNADGSDGGDSEEKASSLHSPGSPLVALPESVRNIETFAEFLRLTPALKPIVPNMSVDELTALCETASRLKYFDGDLFSDVFQQISTRMRAGEFDISHITEVATALVDLNACDASVFDAAVNILMQRIGGLSKDQRLHWMKLLASSGHSGRHASFVSALKAPLPENDAPQVRYCYEWVGSGFCPRGTTCQFAHPKKDAGVSRRKGGV